MQRASCSAFCCGTWQASSGISTVGFASMSIVLKALEANNGRFRVQGVQ